MERSGGAPSVSAVRFWAEGPRGPFMFRAQWILFCSVDLGADWHSDTRRPPKRPPRSRGRLHMPEKTLCIFSILSPLPCVCPSWSALTSCSL